MSGAWFASGAWLPGWVHVPVDPDAIGQPGVWDAPFLYGAQPFV